MNIWKCFEMAKTVANLKEDRRSFIHGCVAIRGDGIIVAASNGAVALSPKDRRGYFGAAHAEFRVCRKIDKGAIVFVVRVGICNGKLKNAKPCQTCQNTMKKHGVTKVYYSISDTEYGTICFKK